MPSRPPIEGGNLPPALAVHALDLAHGGKDRLAAGQVVDVLADPFDDADFLVACDDGERPGILGAAVRCIAFDALAAQK
jgi:tRNA C32,U32 (ribose-2'-O)-methylase TrmJ